MTNNPHFILGGNEIAISILGADLDRAMKGTPNE